MRSLILFINLINVIINIQMLILVNIDVKMLQVNVIVNLPRKYEGFLGIRK